MKTLKLHVGKEFLGEKLGLDVSQFVITEIENNESGLEFTIFTDNDAEVNENFITAQFKGSTQHLMRQSVNSDKGLIAKNSLGETVMKMNSQDGLQIKGEWKSN